MILWNCVPNTEQEIPSRFEPHFGVKPTSNFVHNNLCQQKKTVYFINENNSDCCGVLSNYWHPLLPFLRRRDGWRRNEGKDWRKFKSFDSMYLCQGRRLWNRHSSFGDESIFRSSNTILAHNMCNCASA